MNAREKQRALRIMSQVNEMGRDVRAKRYMHSVIEDHRDPMTDEICCTTLAEDAIDHSGIAFTTEEEEQVFDWAFEVALQYETAERNADRSLRACHWH